MKIVSLKLGDTLVMKKNHPCGSNKFRVLRLGSDIRLICECCKRDLTIPREKLEKMIKSVIEAKVEE
jgi:hypothetical protein